MASPLAVAGTGVRLPTARTVADLTDRLAEDRPLAGSPRRLGASHTDLPPLDVAVGVCDEQPAPARPVRLAGLSRESRLAVCAAADALDPAGDVRPEEVGVLWVSSTAGLYEYGLTCVEAATLDPRQASPLTAAVSAHNGPAAAVSIRLTLAGPHLTLTGSRDAGATALVEAGRWLAEGRCRYVLVGGSAGISRWRMAAAVPGAVPAEGAVCLLLAAADPDGDGPVAKPLRRCRLPGVRPREALADFVDDCLTRLDGPPDAVAVSTARPWWRPARGHGIPWWWVERTGGELGAAGGLHAVVAAVAAGRRSALALAIGGAGNAVAVQVGSRDAMSRGKELSR